MKMRSAEQEIQKQLDFGNLSRKTYGRCHLSTAASQYFWAPVKATNGSPQFMSGKTPAGRRWSAKINKCGANATSMAWKSHMCSWPLTTHRPMHALLLTTDRMFIATHTNALILVAQKEDKRKNAGRNNRNEARTSNLSIITSAPGGISRSEDLTPGPHVSGATRSTIAANNPPSHNLSPDTITDP